MYTSKEQSERARKNLERIANKHWEKYKIRTGAYFYKGLSDDTFFIGVRKEGRFGISYIIPIDSDAPQAEIDAITQWVQADNLLTARKMDRPYMRQQDYPDQYTVKNCINCEKIMPAQDDCCMHCGQFQSDYTHDYLGDDDDYR